jgi:hypothetical protein
VAGLTEPDAFWHDPRQLRSEQFRRIYTKLKWIRDAICAHHFPGEPPEDAVNADILVSNAMNMAGNNLHFSHKNGYPQWLTLGIHTEGRGGLRVWKPASREHPSGQVLQDLELPEELFIHTARFNRGGSFLAGAGMDFDPGANRDRAEEGLKMKVVVWNISTGEHRPVAELPQAITTLVIALDDTGTLLGVAEKGGRVAQIYDVSDGTPWVHDEVPFNHKIYELYFNRKGRLRTPGHNSRDLRTRQGPQGRQGGPEERRPIRDLQ